MTFEHLRHAFDRGVVHANRVAGDDGVGFQELDPAAAGRPAAALFLYW